jgi:hypothetical protein
MRCFGCQKRENDSHKLSSAQSDLPPSVVPGLRAFFRLICIPYRYKTAGTTHVVPGLPVVPRSD